MFLSIVALSLALVVQFGAGNLTAVNEFERTVGCQQFNSDNGYFKDHPYFDTNNFTNIITDENGVTRMRFGVLGEKNAAVRFTSVSTNSEALMTEIALAHYHNTQTDIRKYSRTIPKDPGLVAKLKSFPMRGLMSIYKPVMMTVVIHRGGLVTITKDGDLEPFLKFYDPSFSFHYVGFCDWDTPVIFFYDCPLAPVDGSTKLVLKPISSRGNKFSANSCLKVVECDGCDNPESFLLSP